jgi:hypothetical protein
MNTNSRLRAALPCSFLNGIVVVEWVLDDAVTLRIAARRFLFAGRVIAIIVVALAAGMLDDARLVCRLRVSRLVSLYSQMISSVSGAL